MLLNRERAVYIKAEPRDVVSSRYALDKLFSYFKEILHRP